jgi:hypothetical protein
MPQVDVFLFSFGLIGSKGKFESLLLAEPGRWAQHSSLPRRKILGLSRLAGWSMKIGPPAVRYRFCLDVIVTSL